MTLKFTAFRVEQPIGDFYLAVIPSCSLMRLAQADIRRITDRDLEKNAGIQRMLSRKRTEEIKKYIETVDATFPNAIILNLERDKLLSIKNIQISGLGVEIPSLRDIYTIEVEEDIDTFQIIDGQHRLAGFTEENCGNFELLATIFINLLIEDQAYIFSVINLTQTQVSRSHVYDLFDLAETRSPEKTAHTITKTLNSEEGSPLYRRVKLLGTLPKYEGEVLYRPNLSQGTVVQRILDLISEEPKQDRNLIKKGLEIHLAGDEIEKGLIFRRFFVENKDWAIYKTLLNYFSAVRKNFGQEWTDQTSPLSRAIGYGALMRLLVPLFQRGFHEGDISFEYFDSVFAVAYRTYLQDSVKITFDNFSASGAGETQLFNKLKDLCEV